MHPSTIAAILAFTAGMAVNGAPLNPSVDINPSSRLLTIDDLQYKPEQGDAIHQLVDKRDPQRGRRIGKAFEGIGDAIGGAADLLTIGGAVQGQPQKRDPQRGRGRVIGNIAEGIGGAIGGAADLLTIGGAVQGQNQKRDPQRSRGRLIGNIGEGIGDVIGGAADLITIGGAVQGQPQNQKRDPQRGRGRVIGNIAEGIGGAIGGAADLLTIGGAVQGQPQKRGLTVVDDLGQPVVVSEPADYNLAEGQNEKRDPQRGRRIGGFIKGFGEGVGVIGDLATIGGAIQGQPQKRGLTVVDDLGQPIVASESDDYDLPEAQNEKRDPQRGRRIGGFIKGFGEGVGVVGDLATIGGAIQGQPQKRGLTVVDDLGQPIVASESDDYDLPEAQNEKRDPQRGRRIGGFIKGFGEGVGVVGDLATIGGAIQGQPQKRGLTVVDDLGHPIVASESDDYDLPEAQNEKRDPQRGRRIGNIIKGFGEGVGVVGDLGVIGGAIQGSQPAAKRDVPLVVDDKINSIDAEHSTVGLLAPAIEYEKRDPQRGRGRLIGNIAKGFAGGVGAIADVISVGGAAQGQQPPQKREPQRSKGHVIGNILEGVGGAVGGAIDLGTIAGAIQGQPQKRDPRGHGRLTGNIAEGIGSGIGALAGVISIGGAAQGQQPPQKRDPQRGRGRLIGNILEGVGGAVGGAIDLGTIGGAIQGQPQKRDPQRGHKIGKVFGGIGDGIGAVADIISVGGIGQGQEQPQA
ncbi:hypothetical protein PSV08DRAFT_384410 [Bipolaris maydis]|uniref:uncharacterized protein n=1 Tax=Cochliobolus heterostrophus TaxID=5016 RepID=UPI0024D79470|nr:hypothetical protein PSV08DRAFT_384410 [Bipolaris maydis]